MKRYEALRITDYRSYEVQGQKPTDYNWETILKFDDKDAAIAYAKQVANFLFKTTGKKLIIWNTNGYGIKWEIDDARV